MRQTRPARGGGHIRASPRQWRSSSARVFSFSFASDPIGWLAVVVVIAAVAEQNGLSLSPSPSRACESLGLLTGQTKRYESFAGAMIWPLCFVNASHAHETRSATCSLVSATANKFRRGQSSRAASESGPARLTKWIKFHRDGAFSSPRQWNNNSEPLRSRSGTRGGAAHRARHHHRGRGASRPAHVLALSLAVFAVAARSD